MDKDKGKGVVTEVIKAKAHCTLDESRVLGQEHLHKGNELVDYHAGVMGRAVDHLTRTKYEDLLGSRVRLLRRIARAPGRLKWPGWVNIGKANTMRQAGAAKGSTHRSRWPGAHNQ